jgi:predicted nucleic acid-binding Zn ribbon protein
MTPPDRPTGPKALGDVLGALFASKGLARLRAVGELEEAWADAVGEPAASRTKVGGVRHGVLTVTVGHPTLLEELAAFRKPDLLAALREKAPGVTLHDIRFRIGPVDTPPDGPGPEDPPQPRPRRPRRGE